MGLFSVQRPYEYIIEYFGEFNDIFGPGLHITIPGVTSIRSKVKVNTTQLLELYREESAPILVKDGVEIKPKVTVKINIKEPFAVTYNLDVHDNFIRERQSIGVKYRKDERYFYAIEETLDSLIRSHFGSLNVEAVIELREGEKTELSEDVVKEIEKKADEELEKYGVDVEAILIPEVKVLDKKVLDVLRKKFEATQNEKIAGLQEKVDKALVKVEVQKALQEAEKGKGKGSVIGEQMEILKAKGLSPQEAASLIATQGWSDAAQKGANMKIFSMGGADGKMSVPIMAGLGMGIGQEESKEVREKAQGIPQQKQKKYELEETVGDEESGES